ATPPRRPPRRAGPDQGPDRARPDPGGGPTPMTRFALLYAWRDLTDRSAARSTLVTLGTLVAAIAATLGGFGFAFGVDAVSRKRLEADPFARTLWTGGWRVTGMIT